MPIVQNAIQMKLNCTFVHTLIPRGNFYRTQYPLLWYTGKHYHLLYENKLEKKNPILLYGFMNKMSKKGTQGDDTAYI